MARRRHQLTALRAVAGTPDLRERLVSRGSAAIWLRYLPQRTAVNLDFVDAERVVPGGRSDTNELEARVRGVLDGHFRAVLGGDPAQLAEAQRAVRFDISPPYMPLSPIRHTLPGGGATLLLCDVNYLIAEKLAAMANQMARRRFRPHDAADIAALLEKHGSEVDPTRVRAHLNLIVNAEGGEAVTAGLFRGPLREWMARRSAKAAASGEWQAAWGAVEEFVAGALAE